MIDRETSSPINRQTDLAPIMTRWRESVYGQDRPSSGVTSLFHCNTNTSTFYTIMSFLFDNASTSHNPRYRRRDITSDFIQILTLNFNWLFKRFVLDYQISINKVYYYCKVFPSSVLQFIHIYWWNLLLHYMQAYISSYHHN